MGDKTFSKLPDDVLFNILFLLEDDPRNWARLCCVCKKFAIVIPNVCYKSKCISTLPSITSDLINSSSSSLSPDGDEWASLYKIAVCCPGLAHSGVLLDNSDFGLLRELGPDVNYQNSTSNNNNSSNSLVSDGQKMPEPRVDQGQTDKESDTWTMYEGQKMPDPRVDQGQTEKESDTWTMYDDLYFDTMYDNSESSSTATVSASASAAPAANPAAGAVDAEEESESKKRKTTSSCRVVRSHLASGVWNLSREQGNKLLGSRFRDDCLYVSDWPGCVHMEEKRSYMVFRGVFKNFKRSRVWRSINDAFRSKMDLKCAFCGCCNIWDLHSAFCLKRGFGFHDDGEPVVRAYVCENGHVSGAWTDLPLYN